MDAEKYPAEADGLPLRAEKSAGCLSRRRRKDSLSLTAGKIAGKFEKNAVMRDCAQSVFVAEIVLERVRILDPAEFDGEAAFEVTNDTSLGSSQHDRRTDRNDNLRSDGRTR